MSFYGALECVHGAETVLLVCGDITSDLTERWSPLGAAESAGDLLATIGFSFISKSFINELLGIVPFRIVG